MAYSREKILPVAYLDEALPHLWWHCRGSKAGPPVHTSCVYSKESQCHVLPTRPQGGGNFGAHVITVVCTLVPVLIIQTGHLVKMLAFQTPVVHSLGAVHQDQTLYPEPKR